MSSPSYFKHPPARRDDAKQRYAVLIYLSTLQKAPVLLLGRSQSGAAKQAQEVCSSLSNPRRKANATRSNCKLQSFNSQQALDPDARGSPEVS